MHLGIHRGSKSRYTKMLTNAFSLPGGALNCCMGAWLGHTLAKLGSYVFPLQCGSFILPCLLYDIDILLIIKVIEKR